MGGWVALTVGRDACKGVEIVELETSSFEAVGEAQSAGGTGLWQKKGAVAESSQPPEVREGPALGGLAGGVCPDGAPGFVQAEEHGNWCQGLSVEQPHEALQVFDNGDWGDAGVVSWRCVQPTAVPFQQGAEKGEDGCSPSCQAQ